MNLAKEFAAGKRFTCGRNWTNFLRFLNEERIREAEKYLKEMLEVT